MLDPVQEGLGPNALLVKCKRCGEPKLLNNITKFRNINADLIEWFMECPECGNKTHTYFMTSDLLQRNKRLQTLERICQANPTPGRWNNYMTAKQSYVREFETIQRRFKNRRINEAEQAAE